MSEPQRRSLLEIEQLVKSYEVGEGQPPLRVLDGVDLSLGEGETLAVVGPSGSGKSTLLHIACGLLPPTSGTVHFDGKDLAAQGADAISALRNREIGLVFQDHHLLPQCTVLENALLPTLAGWDRIDPAQSEARARELCTRIGLGERLEHRPARLSGGERQRLAVVRALIREPRLLVADEPTGSLDAERSEELADLLAELNRDLGVALLVVTHSAELARRIGNVAELREGRLQNLAVAG